MVSIPGIQLGSRMVENTSAPLDAKMQLSTTDRLSLSFVQRWLGMIVYDTDLNIWKKLETNSVGDTTVETDWVDFGGVGEQDTLCLNTDYIPTGSEQVGCTYRDNTNGTISTVLENGVILQHGQEQFFHVKNKTGSTLLNGKPVMFVGTEGNSGSLLVDYGISDGSVPAIYNIGILTQEIDHDNVGKVTKFGLVRGISTDGSDYGETWIDGDILYVSATTAGALTNVQPDAPNFAIPIAVVVNANSANGVLFVRPTYPEKLTELSDVDGVAPQDGYTLEYDSALLVWNPSSTMKDHIANVSNPHGTSDANIVISDITTNNSTTLAHGFLPKLSGSASQYLDGNGNWSTISGASVPTGYSETSFSGQTSINVVHNFGVKPLVQVLISSAVSVPFSITHNTDNDLTVTFSTAQSGSIILSAGSQIPNITTVNTNYTITNNDNIVIANTSGIDITLPTAVGVTGKQYSIDNATNGNIRVLATGSETIRGRPSQTIPGNSTIVVYSTGTNRRVT